MYVVCHATVHPRYSVPPAVSQASTQVLHQYHWRPKKSSTCIKDHHPDAILRSYHHLNTDTVWQCPLSASREVTPPDFLFSNCATTLSWPRAWLVSCSRLIRIPHYVDTLLSHFISFIISPIWTCMAGCQELICWLRMTTQSSNQMIHMCGVQSILYQGMHVTQRRAVDAGRCE